MHAFSLRIALLAAMIAAPSLALAHEAYGDDDGYYRDGSYGYARHDRGWNDWGYYGEPRFFRSWHDDVGGYDDAFNMDSYYPYGGAGMLPYSPGLYRENRGYGVEGRGWQRP